MYNVYTISTKLSISIHYRPVFNFYVTNGIALLSFKYILPFQFCLATEVYASIV